MRLLRAITAVLGAVAVGAVVLPGQAGAAPTAPYTVLTVNGRSSLAFDARDHIVQQSLTETGGERLAFWSDLPGHTALIRIDSTSGTKITPGTYATGWGDGTATTYGLLVSIDAQGCDPAVTGNIVINAVTRTGAGALDSISATYFGCDALYGEFRWNSADGYTDAVQGPGGLQVGSVGLGLRSTSHIVTFTSVGSTPLQIGALSLVGARSGEWRVDTNGCTGKTLAYRQGCSVTVSVLPQAKGPLNTELRLADNSRHGYRSVWLNGTGRMAVKGNFFPLGPNRILDTRSGLGAPTGKLGPQQTLSLHVAGQGGVPAGFTAVVLNVTVANATSGSFLAAYPSGTARPTVSNLNFSAGWVGANSVTVPVGEGGNVDIYNEAGAVDVVADVLGYYLTEDGPDHSFGAQFQPHETLRAADTRDPRWGGPLPGHASMRVQLNYNLNGVDRNQFVQALAVNITAVTPQGFGYLTAWNGNGSPLLASTLNFTAGSVVPNFAIVPTTPCLTGPSCFGMPEIGIYNGSAKPTHVIVDVVGYFDGSQDHPGFRFHPLTPTRIGDTRTRLGGPGTLGPDSTGLFTTPAAVRTNLTDVLVANVTGVNRGGAATYLTAYAAGDPRPTASNVNLAPYEVRPNAAFVPLGSNAAYNVYNAASTADVIVDVAGRFDYYPYPLQAGASSTTAAPKPTTPVAGPVFPYVTG